MGATKKEKPLVLRGFPRWLAYLDSNQDKQNQNLSYYHYTIGQSYWNCFHTRFFNRTAKLRKIG
jgi:hypothetical protein